MAALNRYETETLRDAIKVLQHVKSHGFDPKKVDDKEENDHYLDNTIGNLVTDLRTVVQMKGYYPK